MRFSTYANLKGFFFAAIALILSLVTLPAFAEEQEPGVDKAKGHWTVSTGYGVTHPGLGATETKVETAELILSYGHFLSEEVGKSWYRGRHEIIVELPLHYVVSPETTPMVGITFLASWVFTASKTMTPYIFGGGGLIYTNLDVPELGMWFLTHRRRKAMWWYSHVFMPLGLRFQKKLDLFPGMIDTGMVSEALLVCRKDGKAPERCM